VAVKARIAGKRELEDGLEVSVEYFNDANPTKVLASRINTYEASTPPAEILARIQADGLSIKRNRQLVNDLSNSLTVGQEVTI
jgi:hypothetical protein